MEVFTKTVTVGQSDLDELNHVNNVRYVHWIQEISRDHWHHVARSKMLSELVWVVRRHEIDYRNAAVLGDNILMKTYIEGARGPLSTRIVEMHKGGNGLILLRSRTEWCLLDAATQRPMRIPDEIAQLFGNHQP